MKYEHLDHTADLKIRSYGKDLEEAFVNMAFGMFDFITDTSKVKSVDKHEISISAKRKESLLYDFLEELLFLMDTEGFILSRIENLRIEEKGEEIIISCTAQGDTYKNYDVKGNIKSITYSEMSIKEEKDKVTMEVVVDI